MTLFKEMTLPANAEARPMRGATGDWVELAPSLWVSPLNDVHEMVPAGPKGAQLALSYDHAGARLSPPAVAARFPRQATRILARVRAALEEKLATLQVEHAGRERLSPAGFPALNWPLGTALGGPAKQREMHRNRSQALQRFLSAAQAWNEMSEEDVANEIILRIKALALPVTAKLSLDLDGEGGKADLQMVLEDPGLAIPGSGQLVLADMGYRFEPLPETKRAALRVAYAQSLATHLVRSTVAALNGIPVSGQAEVRIGDGSAFATLSGTASPGPVF